ncbi:MAG: hypothetical protein HYX66_01240 [Ignavibacteria bacterium]|nr:hypothetical protein [Ignavibacteria bacterium]
MSQMNFTPPESSEALYAFLDGELDISEEQRLFDELAASVDLRTEMKDVLSIRAAVHRDITSPPAQVESSLLSAVGLGSAVSTGAGAAALATATRSPNILLNRLLSGILGIALGLVIAWFMMDTQGVMQTSGTAVYSGKHTDQQQQPSVVAEVDTVYSTRVITRTVPAQSTKNASPVEVQPADSPTLTLNEETSSNDLVLESSSAALPQTPDPQLHRQPIASEMMKSLRRPQPLSESSYSPMVALRIRTLASGIPQTERVPQSVQDAMAPNTAFSLLFPLAEHHQLGVEMGQESFRQEFTGYELNRQVSIVQTPVLFWIGGTYIVTPFEFSFLSGLSPFAEATLGMVFEQGPIGRGTIGLSYQPVGPLRMTLGLDGSALLYQFQGNSFTSTKWGVSYGLSVDIGSIR